MVPLLFLLVVVTPFAASNQDTQVGLAISTLINSKLRSFWNSASQIIVNQTVNIVDSRILNVETKMAVELQKFKEEFRLEDQDLKNTLTKADSRILKLEETNQEFRLEDQDLKNTLTKADSRIVKLEETNQEFRLEDQDLKNTLRKAETRMLKLEETIQECQLPYEKGGRIANGGTEYLGEMCDLYRCDDGQLRKHTSSLYSRKCPSSYKTIGRLGCVKLIKEEVGWCDARKRCFLDGTDLIIINNLRDTQSVKNFLYSEGYFPRIWIGLRWDSFYDAWMSIRGDKVEKNSPTWSKGEPNANGNCVDTWHNYDGKLTDFPCNTLLAFICQLPSF